MASGGAIRVAVAITLLAAAAAFAAAPHGAVVEPSRLSYGDHAVYHVSRFDDSGHAVSSPVQRLDVDVGATTTVADHAGRPRLATPLEFSFGKTEAGREAQFIRSYWLDGSDAVSVSTQGHMWRGKASLPALSNSSTDSTQSVSWHDILWDAAPMPCGFGLVGPEKAGADCRTHWTAGSPWADDIEGPLADLFGSPGPGHSAYRLSLVGTGRSRLDWSTPSTVAALPALVQAPRSMQGPGGTGPGIFLLGDALRAMQNDPADASARDLVRRHADAYLAYARSYEAVNAAGQTQVAWHLAVVGGTERVERAVTREAAPVPGLPPVTRVVHPSSMEYAIDAAPATLAPSFLAPSRMASIDSLQVAFLAATGQQPTGWGFSIACPSLSCLTIDVHVQVFKEELYPAGANGVGWQRNVASRDRLDASGDGTFLGLGHAAFGQPTPNILATGPLGERDPAQPSRMPWPVTPATVAAGTLGLLGAILALSPAWKYAVALFSRIEASRMLDHPVRRRVYDLVQEDPGIHARLVATRLGIAGNTAVHHLARLVGAGYIGERRIAGYHCYFPRSGLDERLQSAIPALKSRGATAVLNTVAAQGSPSFRSLMAATGLGYATVHHHAESLWKAGLLSAERDGRTRRFRLTELGRRIQEQALASIGRFPTQPKNPAQLGGHA
ncbi:MAG: winged helix-turn-helix transcriptional regulator [bacterium]